MYWLVDELAEAEDEDEAVEEADERDEADESPAITISCC